MKKKLLFNVMTTTALLGAIAFPASAATDLTDINGSYAKDAILELVDKGIINGKGDGKFDPTGKIERQDFAIILAKALSLDLSAAPATATFSDVPTTHYAFKAVEAAAKAGLIKGNGDGTFGLNQNLTRQDMAVLFVRALGVDAAGKGADLRFSDADQIRDYAKDAVGAAVELGFISGNPDRTFNPAGNAERQAVAQVAANFLKKAEEMKKGAPPSQNQDTEPAQPESPATPTPPVSTGGTGSTGGSSDGGTTNPGTGPVTSELAQPAVSISNYRTISLTYHENLDENHIPTPENFHITTKSEGQDTPVLIKNIQVEGKSVLIEIRSYLVLGSSVQLSYTTEPSEHAIRSLTGKRSPVITSKPLTYQTSDPLALLDRLINEGNVLLQTAEPGNTTGKYPENQISYFGQLVSNAVSVRENAGSAPSSITSTIYSLEIAIDAFQDSRVTPLTLLAAPGATFVMNPLRPDEAVTIMDENSFDITDNYNERNIGKLLDIRRSGQELPLSTNIVFDPQSSEGHDFKVIMDDSRVGYLDVESNDANVRLITGPNGIRVSFLPGAIGGNTSLTFKLYDLGAPALVQQQVVPVAWDQVAPTVTEGTYADNTITLGSSEWLFGDEMFVNLAYIPDNASSLADAGVPLQLEQNTDFFVNLPNGEDRLTITLSEDFIGNLSALAPGKFKITVTGLTDFARNEWAATEPITIQVPLASREP